MSTLLQYLLPSIWLAPVIKPLTRMIVGMIAAPLLRTFLRRVIRKEDLDRELQRDLEQWFRGALLLLVASANMESFFFGWVPPDMRHERGWWLFGTRLMLAITVIEGMPDQALFAIIHPGPPKPKIEPGRLVGSLLDYLPALAKGLLCQHLNRLSPVLVIMTVLFDQKVGWTCYTLALIQYLIIGLVSSRDRAMDVLAEFDNAISRQRAALVEEQAAQRVWTAEELAADDYAGGSG